MGLLEGLSKLVAGLTEFFGFFRSFWYLLPFVCQILIVFVFGVTILFALLRMLH